MQGADTVLNVIRERGLSLENIYRLLYNRNLYLRAYGRIYSKQEATTKGTISSAKEGRHRRCPATKAVCPPLVIN